MSRLGDEASHGLGPDAASRAAARASVTSSAGSTCEKSPAATASAPDASRPVTMRSIVRCAPSRS